LRTDPRIEEVHLLPAVRVGDDGRRRNLAARPRGCGECDHTHWRRVERAEVLPVSGMTAIRHEDGRALCGVDRRPAAHADEEVDRSLERHLSGLDAVDVAWIRLNVIED